LPPIPSSPFLAPDDVPRARRPEPEEVPARPRTGLLLPSESRPAPDEEPEPAAVRRPFPNVDEGERRAILVRPDEGEEWVEG
jgi:hypothetical protein